MGDWVEECASLTDCDPHTGESEERVLIFNAFSFFYGDIDACTLA